MDDSRKIRRFQDTDANSKDEIISPIYQFCLTKNNLSHRIRYLNATVSLKVSIFRLYPIEKNVFIYALKPYITLKQLKTKTCHFFAGSIYP